MSTFNSAYTGAQIDSAVGRALPNGAIDTSLSNKADEDTHNLKTYTGFSQLGLSGELSVADVVGAMPSGSTLTVYQSGSGTYVADLPYTYAYLVVRKLTSISAELWCSQLSSSDTSIANYYNGTLSSWQQLATATPPTEYDLPLASGITASDVAGVKYGKNGINECRINGRVTFSNQPEFGTNIGVLPAGFRPSSNLFGTIISRDGSVVTVAVASGGNITVQSAPSSAVPFALNYALLDIPAFYAVN